VQIILSEIDYDGRGPNVWEYDAGDGSSVSVSEGDLITVVADFMQKGYEVVIRSIDWWEAQHNYRPGDRVEVVLTTETFTGPLVRLVSQGERDPGCGPMYVMEIHVYEDEIKQRIVPLEHDGIGREARA
jgi:hypothetical protein